MPHMRVLALVVVIGAASAAVHTPPPLTNGWAKSELLTLQDAPVWPLFLLTIARCLCAVMSHPARTWRADPRTFVRAPCPRFFWGEACA